MSTPNSIGNNIRMWLKIKEIKQEALAKKMDISNSYLSQLINGNDKAIKADRREEIAKHLGIDISQLNINPVIAFDFSSTEAAKNKKSESENIPLNDSRILSELKKIAVSFNELVNKLDGNKT